MMKKSEAREKVTQLLRGRWSLSELVDGVLDIIADGAPWGPEEEPMAERLYVGKFSEDARGQVFGLYHGPELFDDQRATRSEVTLAADLYHRYHANHPAAVVAESAGDAGKPVASPDDVCAKLLGITGPSIARAIATYHAMVTAQPPPPGVIVERDAYHLDQSQASKLEALAEAIKEPREPEMAKRLGAGTSGGEPALFKDGDVRYPASLAEYTVAAQMYSRRRGIALVIADLRTRMGMLPPLLFQVQLDVETLSRWATLLEGIS
jgi:hypothetical protein